MSNENTIPNRLHALRAELSSAGLDGFLVPRADEYQGEYVPARADRLRFISGFTGSAGIAIVLFDRACVLSDGRYTIQLRQQLDPALFETGDSTQAGAARWLAANAPGQRIGFDPRLHTPVELDLYARRGVELVPSENLIDRIWDGRPDAPDAPVELFPVTFAGSSAAEKLDRIAAAVREEGAEAAILTLTDSIAWLLNIRSRDIPHIPVALSYAIILADGTLDWYIDAGRVPAGVIDTFGRRVRLRAPGEIEDGIRALAGRAVMFDPARSARWFRGALEAAGAGIVTAKDPVIAARARKNTAEQAAMRAAHLRDGAAVTHFLCWFDTARPDGLDELAVEEKLLSFRAASTAFRDTSFDTIAGFGPNGAIIHYRANVQTSARIDGDGLLLVDSGGQYEDGTTDITRTIAVGNPSAEMKERYTLVLKAHIALAAARFPAGTTGAQLDAITRAPLWRHGLDYGHGTGHGVGCYLSVHEEAAGISPRGTDPVEAGMILSNEPGYYEEGAYGIRIENLILAHEHGRCAATGKAMLAFETLTLAPYEPSLIVAEMLGPEEKAWLSAYHARLVRELSPLLDDGTRAWLAARRYF